MKKKLRTSKCKSSTGTPPTAGGDRVPRPSPCACGPEDGDSPACQHHVLMLGPDGLTLAHDDLTEEDGPVGRLTVLRVQLRHTCQALLRVLTTPFRDYRRRSHPRTVPDYSLLVLLTVLTNPLMGALVCYLHTQAKNISHRGDTRTADVLYLTVIFLALLTVVSTILGLLLLGAYFIVQDMSQHNTQLNAMPTGCLFTEKEDRFRMRMNWTRWQFCWWLNHIEDYFELSPGYSANSNYTIHVTHNVTARKVL